MLLEEFKSCLPERVVVYLNEQKVTSLQQAATLVDEFMLTHKTAFGRSSSSHVLSREEDVAPTGAGASAPVGTKLEKQCFFCHKPGHIVVDCMALKQKQQIPLANTL